MIGVLLFILKCIGIFLLALICLLLLTMLVVLLAPIRYEAGGEKTDAIRADGQVKWLFVQVVARWQMGDKEPFVDLLIFGKSLLEKKKAKAKAERKKRKKPRPQKEGDLIYTREKAAPPKDTPPEPDIGDPLPGQKARPAGGPSQCREVQPGGRRRSCRLRGGLITGRCGGGGNNRCGDRLGGQGEVNRGVLAGQGERQQQPKGQQSPEQAAPAGPDGFA